MEARASWPQLVALKDQLSLRELSARFETTPSAIVAALKRTGLTRKPARPGRPKKSAAPAAPESVSTAPRRRGRPSKVQPFAHLLGKVPDGEIARRAGVSVAAVRQYRAKRGISANVVGRSRARAPQQPRAAWQVASRNAQGEDGSWVVLASSLSEAANKAQRANKGHIQSIRWIAPLV